jgi:hypothetical protein
MTIVTHVVILQVITVVPGALEEVAILVAVFLAAILVAAVSPVVEVAAISVVTDNCSIKFINRN